MRWKQSALSLILYIGFIKCDKKNRYISLKDKEFVGPDKRLEELVKQRMSMSPTMEARYDAMKGTKINEYDLEKLLTFKEHKLPQTASKGQGKGGRRMPGATARSSGRSAKKGNKSDSMLKPQRRYWQDQPWHWQVLRFFHMQSTQPILKWNRYLWKSAPWFEEYKPEQMKIRILQFQEYLILLTQERIKLAQPTLRNMAGDERYRVAVIFYKLREWMLQIVQLYDHTRLGNVRMLLSKHIRYYQRIHRIYTDICYTVEFLIHTHEIHEARSYRKPRTTARDREAKETALKVKDYLNNNTLTEKQLEMYKQLLETQDHVA